MAKNRPILLLYPPQADITQPYSSLPALTGFLRAKNIPVIQRDINAILFDELLSQDSLTDARDLANERRIENQLYKDENFEKRYQEIIGFSDYLIPHIGDAKNIMRDLEKFSDIRLHNWAVQIINLSCDLVSLPYYPTKLLPGSYEYEGKYSFHNLLEATGQTKQNLFYNLLKRKIIPLISQENPILVGLSVTYQSQVIPGFTLARLLKDHFPDMHVNIGGAIIQRIDTQLFEDPACFTFADSYTIGEGETALEKLYFYLFNGKGKELIPNIIHEGNNKSDKSKIFQLEDIRSFPAPDFDGLDLKLYLSPEPIFLISSTRGCFWGKCAFCDVSMNTKGHFRQIEPNNFSNHFSKLITKSGAQRFWFCDDAMPVNMMLRVSREVRNKFPQVTWATDARLEGSLSQDVLLACKEGGCRLLVFGLESGNQRVLDAMNKNNSVDTDINVIEGCAENGIGVRIQAFLGFPTETRDEAQETIKLLENYQEKIVAFGLGHYHLYKNTPVYKNPMNYGISKIIEPNEDMFSSLDYVPISGMTSIEAEKMTEVALKQLSPIYLSRMTSLSATHHLLHLSYHSVEDLHKIWTELDEPKWADDPDMGELKPTLSSVIFSDSSTEEKTIETRMLNTKTGEYYYISRDHKFIFELCDGKKTIDEIVSLWIKQKANEDDEKIKLAAGTYALIREYLREGVITV